MDAESNTPHQRILEVSSQIFFSRGFAKVTVDEIAAELGSSKKTIYKHYAGKNELLHAVVREMLASTAADVERLLGDEGVDFIDKLIGLMRLLTLRISQIGKPFTEDLRRHAPTLWREINQFRHRKIMANFVKLVRKGQAKGVFRKDIDPELLTVIYAATVQGVVNPQTVSELPYTVSQLFQAIAKTMFIGILTEKAKIVHFHKLKKIHEVIGHA
jgi:AcrR family transcriptional regulator